MLALLLLNIWTIAVVPWLASQTKAHPIQLILHDATCLVVQKHLFDYFIPLLKNFDSLGLSGRVEFKGKHGRSNLAFFLTVQHSEQAICQP